eukprot:COSAG02_NODE_919_length_15936_cov_5.055314_20_plen_95_part_00
MWHEAQWLAQVLKPNLNRCQVTALRTRRFSYQARLAKRPFAATSLTSVAEGTTRLWTSAHAAFRRKLWATMLWARRRRCVGLVGLQHRHYVLRR